MPDQTTRTPPRITPGTPRDVQTNGALATVATYAWRFLLVAAAIAVVAWFFTRISVAVLPVILAVVLASVSVPPARWLEHRGSARRSRA